MKCQAQTRNKLKITYKILHNNTPYYLRAALQKAIDEHSKGIIGEKSALAQFSEKYVQLKEN